MQGADLQFSGPRRSPTSCEVKGGAGQQTDRAAGRSRPPALGIRLTPALGIPIPFLTKSRLAAAGRRSTRRCPSPVPSQPRCLARSRLLAPSRPRPSAERRQPPARHSLLRLSARLRPGQRRQRLRPSTAARRRGSAVLLLPNFLSTWPPAQAPTAPLCCCPNPGGRGCSLGFNLKLILILKEALDGSHHKTLCRLFHMWDSVLEVLENVAEDGVGDKRTTASGLLLQMENFEFVFILHLKMRLLGITNDLSQCLQRKDQNIVRAVGLIGITLHKINDVRQHGWDELFEEVKEFCAIHNIIVPNMEENVTVRGRARGRGGQQVTYYHHFKNEIFNVVHDQVIVELNNRFAERSTRLLRCIACLDPRNLFANYDREKLIELAQIYDVDFSQYDHDRLPQQLDNFISDVRADPSFANCIDLGELAIKMVRSERHTTFPLVYRLIELALILPVATATVERIFSAMKVVKTESRNKMADEWLNHRMVCYVERTMFAAIQNDDILRHFQEMKTRKKKLPSINTSGVVIEDMEVDDANAPNSH